MTTRATQLHAQADNQILALDTLLTTAEKSAVNLPLDNREKLGDGSLGALALLIAENYLRIAEAVSQATADAGPRAGHRIPRWSRHQAPSHEPRSDQRDHQMPTHAYAGPIEASMIIDRLATARVRLRALAELTDSQLDSIPLAGSTRFADGRRNLSQVIERMLKHQRRQQETIEAAIGERAPSVAARERTSR